MHFHADSSEPTVNPGTIAGMSTAACPVRATVRSSFHWERGEILAFSFGSRGNEAPSMLWIPCLQLDGHGGSRTESPDYFVRAKRPFCAAHCFFSTFFFSFFDRATFAHFAARKPTNTTRARRARCSRAQPGTIQASAVHRVSWRAKRSARESGSYVST